MKKVFFFLSLAIAIYLLIELAKIFIYDLHRLTDYGWGYLTGRIVLFLLFTALAILLLRRKKKRSDV